MKQTSPICETKEGCTLSLKVLPRSSRNQIIGMNLGSLKIKLQAPPVDGLANKAVLSFLADFFGIPKKSVSMVSGFQSRNKVVRINGLKSSDILRVLNLK